MNSFSELGLKEWIVKQCQKVGIENATPIQRECVPQILAGKDCIGCAKTGSGKTLAFALPILQKLSEDPYGIFALVLTPTRELAFQIADQFQIMGKPIGLRQTVIVGGMDMVQQGMDLSRKPHIVISTPGRLYDHLGSCVTFSLKKIKFLVIDEADRTLGGDFDEQLKRIFDALPEQRQNLLFSATMTDSLSKVRQVAKKEMFLHETKSEVATVEELKQHYVLCPGAVKDGYLVQIIRKFKESHPRGSIMVFTNTCKNCQLLSMTLKEVGYDNVCLHGMISQKLRLVALNKFKSNNVKILIATDVASRGLDIPEVQLVINHSVPTVPKEYVHRVGRTARAGRGGDAVTLVTPNDIKLIQAIEELINTKLTEYKTDEKEVSKIFTQVSVTRREAEIKLDETDFFEKKELNKRKQFMMEGKDPDEEMEKKSKYKKKLRRQKIKAAIKARTERKKLREQEKPASSVADS
ncbi:probable ATP-dependent RNA helicase DDX49 [Neocloeon triangulifer]|uniref:probable ATP-dependent RNA helicase DDX49 n=1 Tax=Neocloeon triangulifer TaxID=2078957 RepID=UPI00286FA1F1|nr:probable ATP-dependent RNA helicase DDX49 [Neocloeon triangulifer]